MRKELTRHHCNSIAPEYDHQPAIVSQGACQTRLMGTNALSAENQPEKTAMEMGFRPRRTPLIWFSFQQQREAVCPGPYVCLRQQILTGSERLQTRKQSCTYRAFCSADANGF